MDNFIIKQEKNLLRKRLLSKRKEIRPQQNRLIRDSLLFLLVSIDKRVIASTFPLKKEIDLRSCNLWLYHANYQILLPEIAEPNAPLLFRQWSPKEKLYQGCFSTFFPKTCLRYPEIIFVPLLGFDRRGYRIGYGGGYYDRTLKKYPSAIPIGYAVSSQEIEYVPHEAHDMQLRYIVTERDIITISYRC